MGRKFRLRMATQTGERIAIESGFMDFPIDPFQIAEKNNIQILPKPPEKKGISGCIIFHDDFVGIIYSTEINNEGFQRFTVAHELGHYFLEGHPEEIISSGGTHVSKAGFIEGQSSIELEADHFAAGLLMPTALSRSLLQASAVGMEGICSLAEKANCSLTSAAIRAADISPYPIAVVVSEAKNVRYSFLSERFKDLGKLSFLRAGDLLPPSNTLEFNHDTSRVASADTNCGTCNLKDWFNGPNYELDEQVIGLGKYGLTLTVLSSDNLPSDPLEEEDEDKKLEEQWTPRFAYGR